MPELGPYGSVRGARGNSRPYRESDLRTGEAALLTPSRPLFGIDLATFLNWFGITTCSCSVGGTVRISPSIS